LKAHVRGDGIYKRDNRPTTTVQRAGRLGTSPQEEFSGLTARKIITNTQPKSKHVRTYTMQDLLALQ